MPHRGESLRGLNTEETSLVLLGDLCPVTTSIKTQDTTYHFDYKI